MEPVAPPATPEGTLIRFCREVAGMTADEAAAAVKAAGGKISPGYWRDVERGWGRSRGQRVPVRASDGLLARMAREIPGVTPERLASEGQRPEAAKMLAEILEQEVPPLPSRTLPVAAAALAEEGIGKYREVVDFERENAMEPRNEDEARIWDAVGSAGPERVTEEEARTAVAYRRLIWDKAVRSSRHRTGLSSSYIAPDVTA